MARTTAEIKKTMTDAFMADATIRERYGLKAGATWGGTFSDVSVENVLLWVVAACCHVVEVLTEKWAADVEARMASAVVASVPWYYKVARAFQYGDALVLDEATQQYGYATADEGKQVVKYVAVRDRGTSVEILASGEKGGLPEPLSDGVLTAFKQYMNRVKIAGVVLTIRSQRADRLTVRARIWVDPLVRGTDGRRISDGVRAVDEAIKAYLKNIVYGGTFNKTRLTDAIQAVEGVEDVELGDCQYMTATGTAWTTIKGNNYTAAGGSLTVEGLENSMSYVVES